MTAHSDLAVSFEFSPPKTPEAEERLWESIEVLGEARPKFVSVTYGAGGSTRDRTHGTVKRLVEETDHHPAAHLTCVGATREEIDEVIADYWNAGVRHIVALRGDPPEGIDAPYHPHPGGYANAAELTAAIKRIGDFEVSVGCYPEKHPQSEDFEHDLDLLKQKVDAGATRAITQFFFEPDLFFRYLDRVRAAGIEIPIVPGIMPMLSEKGLRRMAEKMNTSIPDGFASAISGIDDNPGVRPLVACHYAADLCLKLIEHGVRDFHFYTLNRSELTLAVLRCIGYRPGLSAHGEN